MLTINQDNELFKNFVLKHKALNSYYFGDEWEVDSTITPVYPLLNAILQGSSFLNGVVTRRYLIVISDLVNKDESNETHVLSDTERICFDLVNYLRQVSNSGLLGAFKSSQDVSLTDFTERNDDEVSGHYFDLTIVSHIGNEGCNLPIDSGNILDNTYIYVGGGMSGGFLVEIKDQDGNVIETFNTSGEYIVTVLSKIKQVIGSTSTTIIQDVID